MNSLQLTVFVIACLYFPHSCSGKLAANKNATRCFGIPFLANGNNSSQITVFKEMKRSTAIFKTGVILSAIYLQQSED